MKRSQSVSRTSSSLLRMAWLFWLLLPATVFSGTVDLTNIPLMSVSGTPIKPNLMFILDNSGSMERDYLPDPIGDSDTGNQFCKEMDSASGYATYNTTSYCCRGAGNNNQSGDENGTFYRCYPNATINTGTRWNPKMEPSGYRGMPPFHSSDFNKTYYDPAITYTPPVNYDGTSKTSYSGAGSVPWDGYGIQQLSTATITLTSDFPDVEWCTTATDKDGKYTYADCVRNNDYVLPGKIGSTIYSLMHATTATGSNYFAERNSSGVNSKTTDAKSTGPYYYVIIPGEYCRDEKLTDCRAQNAAQSGSDGKATGYMYPAKVRWCSDQALTVCQKTQTSTYKYVRYPTLRTPGRNAQKSTGKIIVTGMPQSAKNKNGNRMTGTDSTCTYTQNTDAYKAVVTSIKLKKSGSSTSTELLKTPLPFTYCNGDKDDIDRNSGLATEIANRIGNSFTASANNNVITITAPDGTYNNATLEFTITNAAVAINTIFSGGAAAVDESVVPGSFKRIDIVSGSTYGNVVASGGTSGSITTMDTTIVDRSNRSDCSGSVCTYDNELQNFANWMAWYRTRMQMMKTVASLAFDSVDDRYRVGFVTINGASTNFLNIKDFEKTGTGSQKQSWYEKLFSINPDGSTPLRSALANTGLMYAGKQPLGVEEDPVQYSCQQNFAFLTTDGYWNSDSSSSIKQIDGKDMGNWDYSSTSYPTEKPYWEGPSATTATLADVAMYFYRTDLRPGTPGTAECTKNGQEICEDNVYTSVGDTNKKQHMTTFTLGLGVDGTLQYTEDYKSPSGDYKDILEGRLNWPAPSANSPTAIDDLWHAAVNGRGTYFSAKNPTQLSRGITSALKSIDVKTGAGAAAATSSLNPVAGDNFSYVASYTTGSWTGNLQAHRICLLAEEECPIGSIKKTPEWCVEPNSAYTNCSSSKFAHTAGATLGTVSATSDTRKIYTNVSGSLTEFKYGNLTSAQKKYFTDNLVKLTQYTSTAIDIKLSDSQKAVLTGTNGGENLVNYLRGQFGYETGRTGVDVNNQIFRYREATLGDAMEAEPKFVGKPVFMYADEGYGTWKESDAIKNRAKTVFLGTNDGMLHAFDAENGTERWAYIPGMILKNLWHLADRSYASNHVNYMNGSPYVLDVYDSSQKKWRSVLVSGLSGGGRGYFALDITNPASPSLLWEIDSNTDSDIGYTYGPPIIAKRNSDEKWVVMFSSGYNNVSPGTGKGYLFVRDALTGAEVTKGKIDTEAGDTTTPSGLAKIMGWADDQMRNNKVKYVYGGDLLGNLWRFDIDEGTAFKLAELKNEANAKSVPSIAAAAQPITTTPELGLINNKRVVFVATGKFLEDSDLTSTQPQTVYAIMDDEAKYKTSLTAPRDDLVKMVITTGSTTRTMAATTVDWSSKRGWYADLPSEGERVHVDPKLDGGILFVASTVPTRSGATCNPGGKGWLNYFDYMNGSTGAKYKNEVSQQTNSPTVGISTYYINGTRRVAIVTADNTTLNPPTPEGSGLGGFAGKRAIWRELIP